MRWVGRKRRRKTSSCPLLPSHHPLVFHLARCLVLHEDESDSASESEPAKSLQLGDRLNASSETFESNRSRKGGRFLKVLSTLDVEINEDLKGLQLSSKFLIIFLFV